MRTITIEAEVKVDVLEVAHELTDEEIRSLFEHRYREDGGKPHTEIARELGVAIERGDDRTASDLLHRLCFDMAGVPVTRQIAIVDGGRAVA